jgi:hypothetical protein
VYPKKITVVGYGVKEARFRELHRAAIHFPSTNFSYHGIDLEGDLTAFKEGEVLPSSPLDPFLFSLSDPYLTLFPSALVQLKYGFTPFQSDPYGCHPFLLSKKQARGRGFARWNGYSQSAPEMRGLLGFCSEGEELYAGRAPWEEMS